MKRVLKVFLGGPEQQAFVSEYPALARYDAFVVVEVPPEAVAEIARTHLVEDITDQYAIEVGGRRIDTREPRLDAGGVAHPHPAYRGLPPVDARPHHYLVQFIGPVKAEWVAAVKKAGGEPREPFGGFTYVVRATGAAAARIARLPSVRWVGHLSHRDRIAPSVARSLPGGSRARDAAEAESLAGSPLPRTRVLDDVFVVELFGPGDVTKAVPVVKKLGLRVLSATPKARTMVVETAAGRKRAAQLTALAAVHGVRQIRERTLDRPSNNVATGIMGTAAATGNSLGLSGLGELVAVCDTGLDTGQPSTVHPDFKGRVASVKSYPITRDLDPYISNPRGDDGPADLDSGHGTHVAGSVLGNGAASAGLPGQTRPIRALAYRARLLFQAVEQEVKWKNPAHAQRFGRYGLWGIPNDLGDLFGDAYRRGARIHSNSWGGGQPGEYDAQCRQLDQFVWDHKDLCVLVAAGNDGTDRDGDGRINAASVTSPGTAKNCITVGACETLRTEFNTATYGRWWPADYPVRPFRNDAMADDPTQVVAFSSRGPAADGRIKPDVVAPGTFILSTRSTMIAANNMGWAAFPPSRLYVYMGGTSMATPLTAGAVALLREYLRKRRRLRRPSAALLKAALIAGAIRVKGAATGAVADNDQGHGRVNLDAVVAPAEPAQVHFEDVSRGLRTGDVHSMKVSVSSPAGPFRVALVYSDFPGPTLINNLNLVVTAPGGAKFAGNQVAGGPPRLDSVNNVEVAHIDRPEPGAWQVEVIGANVPSGPQDFALAIIAHM